MQFIKLVLFWLMHLVFKLFVFAEILLIVSFWNFWLAQT